MKKINKSLLNKAYQRKDIDKLDDGYFYFFNDSGAITAAQLREIADELDRRNADWDKQVKQGLGGQDDTSCDS